MSQAGTLGVGATPSIATSFVTNNGTATPAANVLNVLGADTTANNVNGIQTSAPGSASTVTVELTNRLQGTTTTVGAVTGDIITFALDSANPAVYRFEIMIAGRDTGTGDGVGYIIDGTARTDGAAATIIKTPDIGTDEDNSLLTAVAELVVSGNNVIVRVTGVTKQTINFSAIGTYVVV